MKKILFYYFAGLITGIVVLFIFCRRPTIRRLSLDEVKSLGLINFRPASPGMLNPLAAQAVDQFYLHSDSLLHGLHLRNVYVQNEKYIILLLVKHSAASDRTDVAAAYVYSVESGSIIGWFEIGMS